MVWKLRNPQDYGPENKDESVTYGIGSELFTIKLHYCGKFVKVDNKLVYVDEKIGYIDDCSVDEMSMFELKYMATELDKELNQVGYLAFYCSSSHGVVDCSSLVQLMTDTDTLEIFKYVGQERMVDLFVCDEEIDFSCLTSEIVMPGVEDSSDSEGEVSFGEDSNHSQFYDSDGYYYDEDFKVDIEVDVNKLMIQLSERGKKPWEIGENENFPGYSGQGSSLYNDFKVFNPETDMNVVKLEREMCFTSVEVFRDACRKHAVDNGRTLLFPINKPRKVQVKCAVRDCPFYVFASKSESDNTLQIKVIHFEHDCIRDTKTKQADTRFLVKKYGAKIRRNPNWEAKAMLAKFIDECKVNFSKKQMYRAKQKIVKMDSGDGSEQFGVLRQYGNEILRSNPGSTVKIKTRKTGDNSYFKRMYICWGALKEGMLDGCRQVILLDGCHIRTVFGGILLTAIGIDANNSMYPFAYAVVEKEHEKSWLWFLELVKSDLNIINTEEWTFMSDKQKGLVKAVTTTFTGCEHRFCVVHLYSNFKLKHKGLTLKDILWKAARATRIVDFERAMEEMKEIDLKAYEWLRNRPPENWSKAFFKTACKSDILLNNLSESFNGSIGKIRMLPILWMLESIRFKLMETIGDKKQKMMRYRGKLCPRILGMYEKNLLMSTEFTPHWNGNEEFNVQRSTFGTSYRVHLPERFCSCRRWQLTGIPCAHAICGLTRMGETAADYIDECYSKDTYLRIYSHYLMPIASREEWPIDAENAVKILPPYVETQPGRPKDFKRIKQPGEVKGKIIQPSQVVADSADKKFGKMSREGGTQRCGSCREIGHNARKCPTQSKIPAEKRKDIPGTIAKSTIKKKKKDDISVQIESSSSVQIESISSKKISKLQVRRNVEDWLNCSRGGVSLSQPNSSGFHSSSVVTSGLNLSQPVSGKFSRHVGEASFSKNPVRAKNK